MLWYVNGIFVCDGLTITNYNLHAGLLPVLVHPLKLEEYASPFVHVLVSMVRPSRHTIYLFS